MQPDLLSLYPQPDEHASDEQFDRFHGRDLASLTEEDLRRELSYLRVVNFVSASEWHLEREVRVAAELASRRNHRNRSKRP